MTHPFHPLVGQQFEVMTRRSAWGEERVFFYEGERLRALPARWTDLVEPPPFVTLAAGRADFRPEDLADLCALVADLKRTQDGASCERTGEPVGVAGASTKLRRSRKLKFAVDTARTIDRKRYSNKIK